MTRTSTRTSLKFAVSLFAAALTVAASTPMLHAQGNQRVTVVKVPFAFEFGTSHYEPGAYTIRAVGDHFMEIDNSSTSSRTIARWDSGVKISPTSKVVFHHYGNKYFLREVWQAGQTDHLQSTESSAESKLRKAKSLNIAANAETGPAIEVAVQASLY